jgi:hypothetical protein
MTRVSSGSEQDVLLATKLHVPGTRRPADQLITRPTS